MRLKQGILFDTPNLTLPAFRSLYEAGDQSISSLVQELNRIELTKIEQPEIASLAVALLTVLHDLSEEQSAAFIKEVPIDQCHPIVAAGFRRVRHFSITHFRKTEYKHIEILTHKSIDHRYMAAEYLARWLETVDAGHLDGLARVYVIKPEAQQDFLGYYLAHVGVIVIVWDTSLHPWIPLQWPFRFLNERTLYHEVGHHSLRHLEPGQVPQQEEEAELFADQQLRRSHLWLAALRKLINRLRPRASRRSEE